MDFDEFWARQETCQHPDQRKTNYGGMRKIECRDCGKTLVIDYRGDRVGDLSCCGKRMIKRTDGGFFCWTCERVAGDPDVQGQVASAVAHIEVVLTGFCPEPGDCD